MSEQNLRFWVLPCLALSLIACKSESNQAPGAATGFVSIAVTDAPIDEAHKVCVEFSAVEFKHSDGAIPNLIVELTDPIDPDVAKPAAIDLYALQGENHAPLLVAEPMEAGQYNWIRLYVNADRDAEPQDSNPGGPDCAPGASYIVIQQGAPESPEYSVHNLYIPSGAESGLKLNRGFVLPAGGSMDFTIDFDLRKSITAPPGQNPDYILRPTLRIVDNAMVGTLQGSVDASLITGDACAVYVFAGDVIADDYDGDGDALTSAKVTSDDGMTYGYKVGFLAEGDYTAAFTCDADDPNVDADAVPDDAEAVNFTEPNAPGNPLAIVAGESTERNFGP